MTLNRLLFRNLTYYWRTNLPIIVGVAIAVAVLSGALLVGESVEDSLRRLLYERIGSTEYAVTADHFFSEDLLSASGSESCPVIYLKGTVAQEATGIRAHDVNVYGIDSRFWKFHGLDGEEFPDDRAAFVGAALARQLGLQTGDGLLLRVESQQAIPREWLYGRRENVGRTIRLSCRAILPPDKLGEFSLRPSQGDVYSIFVPLARLRRDLGKQAQLNTILLGHATAGPERIRVSIKNHCTLQDLGLNLRDLHSGNGFSLESDRIILDDSVAREALQAAASLGMKVSPLYTYLANSIRAGRREIPYSVITAADLGKGALASIEQLEHYTQSALNPDDSIWLTDWAQRDLGVSPGDSVEVDYFIWTQDAKLATRTARFRLAGVVSTSGDVDATLAPDIPGITEARSISAWDPPFPIDLSRIRREDEDYWNRHRATPKAFITLARGQALWENRFGRLTALRIRLPEAMDLQSGKEIYSKAILSRLDPQQAGFAINAIREQGLSAAQGSTDFGEYFVYFSSFLIAAAILLSALFFKLMIEQRVREIGILRAAGFPANMLKRIFLYEGLLLSAIGSVLGLLGSLGYGWLMVFGLRTWWVGAVGTRRLDLHISWMDLSTGVIAGMAFSIGALLWTLRGLRRNSPRSLLTGLLESTSARHRRVRVFAAVSVLALTAALMLLAAGAIGRISQLPAFFGAGFLLLISILCSTALYLRRSPHSPVAGNGWPAFFRLGLRNAMHRPGRSILCASLIASATFIIVSMEAFRQDEQSFSLSVKSGTGGYPLIGESDLPIINDLNSEAGLEAAGIATAGTVDFSKVTFISFRERPGDDASCLNLYAPQEPKILGAPRAFLAAGRFSFQDSLASDPERKRNPWLLLESSPAEGVIPAIADANTIQYILHLSLGSELTVRAQNGTPVRLRLVAALRDSIFQGELLISESNFLRAFPEREGYRFFLIEAPPDRANALVQPLQEALADWGLAIEASQHRLSAYHLVENTYLSTFQSLGSLGLVLGTLGLATVLLRNVLERRRELALLRAVGYRRRILSWIIVAENMVLASWGLVSGVICALVAIVPALHARGASFSLSKTLVILGAVLAAGLISSLFAVVAAFRSPLLPALHSE